MDKYNINKEDFEYGSDLGEYEAEKIRNIKIDELNQDPTIAIIDYRITSEEELNRIYTKYSLLPRKFKRFSNYYSTQLLGYNVPNMYSIMVDRLVDNDYIFGKEDEYELSESAEVLNETRFKSKPDVYYHKKEFDSGKINLCLIIGYSGSGKSTFTREYKGKNIEKIELDSLVCPKDHFLTIEKVKERSIMMYDFFKGPGKKYFINAKERDEMKGHKKVFTDFIDYAVRYANTHKQNKYIIEGIWIYVYEEPQKFDKYTVYIKGVSKLKASLRRINREIHVVGDEGLNYYKRRVKEFSAYLNDTKDSSKLDKWIKYYSSKPESVLKTEEGEIVKEKFDYYMDLIDECVVKDGDLESIYESIMDDEDLTLNETAKLGAELHNAAKDMLLETSDISKSVPWFTLDEGYTDESVFKDSAYGRKLVEAATQYKYNPSEENKKRLLSLGWNPSLPVNESTMEKAKQRQSNWFRQRGKSINDLIVNEKVIEEGTFNQVIMGFKIHPHQNLEQTLKVHKYPGYINLINKINNKDDLDYIRKDINQGIRTIEKIKEKIISKDQSNKYVKLGITEKDCNETIKWFDTVAKKAISDKIKSLK